MNCDCWRIRSKKPVGVDYWAYRGQYVKKTTDAINFQTDRDVILQGYRLWGVGTGSAYFRVTILLYKNGTLVAEKTGSYATRSSDRSFEVHFSKMVRLRAGVAYTAMSKITANNYMFFNPDGITNVSCSGVAVSFQNNRLNRDRSSVRGGQIPALIFRSLQC